MRWILCAFAWVGLAQAQSYPSKPIRLVLGFPSGTTIDVMMRPIAPRMSEALGQQVVVDNRPGATGMIANEHVAKSPGDGYTLLAAPGSSLTAMPHLRLKMPYDAIKDFAPAGTPRDIVGRLNTVIAKILNTQEIRELWASQRAEIVASTPAQVTQRFRSDFAKYEKLVKAAGIKPE